MRKKVLVTVLVMMSLLAVAADKTKPVIHGSFEGGTGVHTNGWSKVGIVGVWMELSAVSNCTFAVSNDSAYTNEFLTDLWNDSIVRTSAKFSIPTKRVVPSGCQSMTLSQKAMPPGTMKKNMKKIMNGAMKA